MENCSRSNSGTVSRIQFKLGTGLTTQVASCDMTPRSKGQGYNVTYPVKNSNNSVLVGHIKFILGA